VEEKIQTHHQDKVVLIHKEENMEELNKEEDMEAKSSTVRDTPMVMEGKDDD
jgi:hypothetical protein